MMQRFRFLGVLSGRNAAAFIATLALGVVLFHSGCSFAQTAHTSVLLDQTFRTPAPPNNAFPQNPGHVFVATTGMVIVALIMVVVAIFEGLRFRSTVPLAIVIGAAFCVYPESIDNYLGGCFWSQSHDPSKLFYFLMGREIDHYVIAMWWAFGAVLGYVLYATLIRNAKTETVWLAFALAGIADIVFEEILLGYGGIYMYFGHQPLVLISRFPWWWLPTNVAALFLSVAIAYKFRAWLNGWKSGLIFILMPVCYIGGFAFAAMPAVFVINGDFSPVVTQMGGILTVALALIEAAGIMYFILGRQPFALTAAAHDAELGSAGSAWRSRRLKTSL